MSVDITTEIHRQFLGVEIHSGVIVAAFFGAMVLAILTREKNPGKVLAMVFIGVFAGVFFTPVIMSVLPNGMSVDPEAVRNASGAAFGMIGMKLMNKILDIIDFYGLR